MSIFRTIYSFPRDLSLLPRSIRWIALVMFLYYLGWGIIEPFLGIYFNDLFDSYTSVGIIFSLLYVFSMLLSLPFGDLADKASKRTIMTIILICYVPIGPFIATIRTIGHAVLFRVYHAFLATGLWSSTEAYVRSHSPRRQASEGIGFFDMAIAGSSVVGAILGGILITRFGIETLFYIMPVFSIGALIAVSRLPDSDGAFSLFAGIKDVFRQRLFRHEFRDFFSVPGTIYLTALSFLYHVAAAGVIVLLPLVYRALGVSLWEIGIIYAVFMMPAFFEGPFSVIADRANKKTLFLLGAGAAILIEFSMVWAHSVIALFGFSLLLGIAFALVRPLIEGMMTNCMPPAQVGEFNGVYRSFVLLALAIGSFVIGPVADAFTIQTPFFIGAVLMCIFFIVAMFLPRALLESDKA
ncbi:MAG: MFS transporter [bacterium]|nr:MFS transporter [bacterium]